MPAVPPPHVTPTPTFPPPPPAQPQPANPQPANPQPAAPPAPTPQPAAPAQPPAPAQQAGPVQLLNEGPAVRRMRSVYPPALLAAGTRGEVTLEVVLDAQGRVQSAIDVQANNEQFLGPALTIAHELRFTTPQAAGQTVRVRMRFQPAGSSIQVISQ